MGYDDIGVGLYPTHCACTKTWQRLKFMVVSIDEQVEKIRVYRRDSFCKKKAHVCSMNHMLSNSGTVHEDIYPEGSETATGVPWHHGLAGYRE